MSWVGLLLFVVGHLLREGEKGASTARARPTGIGICWSRMVQRCMDPCVIVGIRPRSAAVGSWQDQQTGLGWVQEKESLCKGNRRSPASLVSVPVALGSIPYRTLFRPSTGAHQPQYCHRLCRMVWAPSSLVHPSGCHLVASFMVYCHVESIHLPLKRTGGAPAFERCCRIAVSGGMLCRPTPRPWSK
jgi:hypothetical protein